MLSSRFSLWAVALLTFVTLCTARTVITTQRCTTRYCGHAVAKPHTLTKIVNIRTPYTVTRWKTITKPKATATLTGTKSVPIYRYTTIYTVTLHFTKWVGTSTHTRKFTTRVPATTVTDPLTTKTITPATIQVPTPKGFLPVYDDPENVAAGLKRREAEPEPEPEPIPGAKQYASAVSCTKTYLTKTGTSDLWKTTTKTTGTTSKTLAWTSITYYPDIITITAKNAPTISTTTTAPKVVFDTTTITISVGTATVYETTVTTTIPVATNYLACGARNQAPPPAGLQNFLYADYVGPDAGEPVYVLNKYNNGTAYDCCALCFEQGGPDQCVGSVWYYIGPWGPPCLDWETIDCEWGEFEATALCRLIMASSAPGTCPRHTFRFAQTSSDPPVVVSNGPKCNRFKFQKRTQF
jgi:hypothetical protein